jgi:hypothetical protein
MALADMFARAGTQNQTPTSAPDSSARTAFLVVDTESVPAAGCCLP